MYVKGTNTFTLMPQHGHSSQADHDMFTSVHSTVKQSQILVVCLHFVLFRVSEYTTPTMSTDDYSDTLSVNSFNSTFTIITVNTKASKTDPFRQSCHINIGSTQNLLYPINAL